MRQRLLPVAAGLATGAIAVSGVHDVRFGAFLFAVAILLFFVAFGESSLKRWYIRFPKMVVFLAGAFGFIVFAGGAWLLVHAQDEPSTQEQKALIERYRRFIENSEAPNKTTLIELTNVELKARGTNIHTRIKAMNQHYEDVARDRQARHARKEIDDTENARLWREDMAQVGAEFDTKYRVDARMILLELRNRIPESARKHIVGLPGINPSDKRDGQVSLYDVMPPTFAGQWAGLLANEIEELVKLLPDKS